VGESYPNRYFTPSGAPGASRRQPFIDYVMGAQLPPMWKGLNMDRYDGTTDPDEHMGVYTTHMSLYTSDNVVLCWMFPTSLKEGVLSWFTRLPPNSIDYFETLVSKFGTQFATSQPHHLTSIALVYIRQEKGESLRLFVERFSKVTLNIRNLHASHGHNPMVGHFLIVCVRTQLQTLTSLAKGLLSICN